MPELAISAEKVRFLIEKTREFDVKEGASDPDSGSNATAGSHAVSESLSAPSRAVAAFGPPPTNQKRRRDASRAPRSSHDSWPRRNATRSGSVLSFHKDLSCFRYGSPFENAFGVPRKRSEFVEDDSAPC